MNGDLSPLIGVVLAGGRSQRMGTDKASLLYHDCPQRDWTVALLTPYCKEVFGLFKYPPSDFSLPFMTDDPRFGDNGPIAGILTVMDHYPKTPLLVVGCDYPLLDMETIEILLNGRSNAHICTSFRSPTDGRPEPLIAIYEKECFSALNDYHRNGNYSLRKFLENNSTHLLDAPDASKLESYDTPEQAQRLLKKEPDA
ncbi:MAG: NTP transferase domain-containing protein [Bacteroidota bacterium]